MFKVAYLSDGRDWAYGIAKKLAEAKGRKWELSGVFVKENPPFPLDRLIPETHAFQPKEIQRLDEEKKFDPYDVILVYGWSWILPERFVENHVCICNHPSPLPKYRGGTPIQNQIIHGEKASQVSLFRILKGIDDGPIYLQKNFSLEGHLQDILRRMEQVGAELTFELLDRLSEKTLKPIAQDETKATVNVRRKPQDSELTQEKLKGASLEYLWNFTRMLEDPYPNSYLKLADGKKIFIKQSEKDFDQKGSFFEMPAEELSKCTSKKIQEILKHQKIILKTKDGKKLLLVTVQIDDSTP